MPFKRIQTLTSLLIKKLLKLFENRDIHKSNKLRYRLQLNFLKKEQVKINLAFGVDNQVSIKTIIWLKDLVFEQPF